MSDTQILIVEDELLFAYKAQSRLRGLGYVVRMASSGEEALRQAQRRRPDLALMDIHLAPDGMDGITAAERLWSHFDVPVVYITAHADPESVRRAKSTYAFGYLLKPLRERELEAVVEFALYKHRMDAQSRETNRRLEDEISARKHTEEALRVHQIELETQNEELRVAQSMIEEDRLRIEAAHLKYVDLYDFAPVGYCTFDGNGRILEANLTSAGLFGIERGNLLDTRVYRWVLEADRDRFYHHLHRLADTRTRQICELRLITPDGAERWAQLDTISLAEHQYRTAISDITKRKRAEKALQESEERFRAMFEQAGVGVALVDTATGRYLRINQKYCDFVGYARAEMLRKTFMEVTHADDVQTNIENNALLMAGKSREYSFEKRYVRKDGAIVWGNLTISPLWKSGEEPEAYFHIAIVENITERKRVEAELRQAKEAADDANRAKSEFLAHMSHELRTPLNGILGYAQILQRDDILTEAQRTGLSVIESSGNHLLTLINEILDLAKIEARSVELHPAEVALPEFLRGITAMIQVRAHQKGIAFQAEFAPDLPAIIIADEQRLRQILLNLLNNAVKFTDQGTVSLRVFELDELDELHESDNSPTQKLKNSSTRKLPNSPTHQLRFDVEDTGSGMTAEDLDDIFAPFRQVGDARQHAQGTGLGLSISQQLAGLMGGVISVTSTPGQGSLFGLTLRFAVGEHVAAALRAASALPVGFEGTSKLLIVDDRAESRAVLHDMLRPVGFDIQEAATGQAGIDLARAWRPDVIFMDLMLPDIHGCDAVQRIRAGDGGQAPVIIAVSADVFTDTCRKSLEAGCNAFLPKPVRLDDALNILRTHLTVTWIYPAEPAATDMSDAASALIIPPSPASVAELLRLAEIGDITAIRQQCAALLRQHPRRRPFAIELNRLTQEFQMKALRTFLTAYLRP